MKSLYSCVGPEHMLQSQWCSPSPSLTVHSARHLHGSAMTSEHFLEQVSGAQQKSEPMPGMPMPGFNPFQQLHSCEYPSTRVSFTPSAIDTWRVAARKSMATTDVIG